MRNNIITEFGRNFADMHRDTYVMISKKNVKSATIKYLKDHGYDVIDVPRGSHGPNLSCSWHWVKENYVAIKRL
jgi:hypothetical protein